MAISTKVTTSTGSHVVTIVTSNDATAAEPEPAAAAALEEDWLGLARGAFGWFDFHSCDDVDGCAKGAAPPDSKVVVQYGHYKTAFPFKVVTATVGGQKYRCVRWPDIDEEYALSFVFQGDPHVHVRCFPPGTNSSSDPEETPVMPMAIGEKFTDESGERDASQDEMYFFLTGGGEGEEGWDSSFLIEVEEDEEAGIRGVVEGGGSGGIQFATAEELGVAMGGAGDIATGGEKRKEGCSCLYGNPCLDQYVCLDWANRFEVAKKNGWMG